MSSPECNLILGDSTKRTTVGKESVDLTITSPPYNVGLAYDKATDDGISYDRYLEFTRKWLSNTLYWTRPTGRLCLNVGLDKNKNGKQSVCADMTQLAKDVGWKYHATIIWNEGTMSRHTAWGSWLSASAPHVIAPVEVIIVLYKDEWRRSRLGKTTITKEEFMSWTKGVWHFGGAKKNGHPAPFPNELPRRCIRLFSYLDDMVFDPFAGSGTTLVAAHSNGRSALGVEISENYYEVAMKRLCAEICQTRLPDV